ncbi:hypothetical protein [Yinghuangia sp. YIM S10712]|uniref:hypothetical protein n=1 Tax=Yinghuangia sp. YIM S10712 TaxID=3436930 RepID=UPI003F52B1E2
MDADTRIARMVDDARRRRERQAQVRAEFAAARAAGLRRRHARKLARLLAEDPDDHGPTAA